jgi:hypothetical protein
MHVDWQRWLQKLADQVVAPLSINAEQVTGGVFPIARIPNIPWAKITSTPTTLAGYGITDPVVLTTGSYANPAWITSLAGSKLTGAYTADGLTMATARLLGRTTAGTGAAEEISVAGSLTLSAGVLTGGASGPSTAQVLARVYLGT